MSWLEVDLAERRIREAMARGEFDDLPGAGKPLDLRDADDPDWWIRRKIAEERLGDELGDDAREPASAIPVFALRREAKGFPESLRGLGDERRVREVLDDYNARVKRDRLAPSFELPPGMRVVIAPLIDVDDMVRRWRELRGA